MNYSLKAYRMRFARQLIHQFLLNIVAKRSPDFIIGGEERPYLRRWYLTPWRRWKSPLARLLPNIYLHQFLRSDDDRAMHDHPWFNLSFLLLGDYVEHTIDAGGIHRRTARTAGDLKLRGPRAAHRIEVAAPCWTLFITGPVLRDWGFHCPEQGWVPWQKFVDERDSGAIGKGCAQ